MLVKTRVHEADRHKVKVGQLCYVSVPAVPGKVFTGKVAKIARYADSAHRWLNPELKEHTTEILLDDVHEAISPGDTAEVKIIIGEKQNVLQVPVQSVYSRGPRSFAFVKSGRSIKPVEIKIGESSTTMVEVVEGLSSGDQVALHVGEELLAALPAPSTADIEMQKKAQAERQARMRAEQSPGAGERGGRRMGEAGRSGRSGPAGGGMRRGRSAGNRQPAGSGSDGSGKK
jgi:HlyD family secretion protein